MNVISLDKECCLVKKYNTSIRDIERSIESNVKSSLLKYAFFVLIAIIVIAVAVYLSYNAGQEASAFNELRIYNSGYEKGYGDGKSAGYTDGLRDGQNKDSEEMKKWEDLKEKVLESKKRSEDRKAAETNDSSYPFR